jgi:predicted nucleic-acid-binding protein
MASQAIDTNLLVRLVTNDDPDQARRAAAAIDACEACFVPLTVTLELEWVLRGAYHLSTEAVVDAFDALLGVRHLHFEQEPTVRSALALLRQGVDFADALHHLGSRNCTVLLSFDRSLIRQAERLQLHPAVEAP